MRRIQLNTWFSLPYLGTDVFAELRRSGVEYDKKFGFRIGASTKIEKALEALSTALGEPVSIARSCFVCGRPFSELDREDAVICVECLKSEDPYAIYAMKFATLMEDC
jgi:hypothetical protein